MKPSPSESRYCCWSATRMCTVDNPTIPAPAPRSIRERRVFEHHPRDRPREHYRAE
jgi:hypothetical protein